MNQDSSSDSYSDGEGEYGSESSPYEVNDGEDDYDSDASSVSEYDPSDKMRTYFNPQTNNYF